ncbi:MAG: radical SAM protein, partial [Clostridia bacterium]|nr:radical SAM protein [Clostridia bacterium]
MSFSVLIKPASAACNLRCRYCFYADVSDSRAVKNYGNMSSETAHKLIDNAFAANRGGTVSFAFQGGEPTLAGLEFFRDFTAYAAEHCPKNTTLAYSLQTNGTLLTDEWCAFLKEHGFLVGLSMDGHKKEHDFCRVDAKGSGTFTTVMETVKRLRAHKVDFNILTVLTRPLARHPQQLMAFYKKNDFKFVQIIPCLDPLEGDGGDYSLTPELYASFLKTFFRLWVEEFKKGNYISVRLFDNLVRMAAG